MYMDVCTYHLFVCLYIYTDWVIIIWSPLGLGTFWVQQLSFLCYQLYPQTSCLGLEYWSLISLHLYFYFTYGRQCCLVICISQLRYVVNRTSFPLQSFLFLTRWFYFASSHYLSFTVIGWKHQSRIIQLCTGLFAGWLWCPFLSR